jgi:hypothetical protein
LRYRKLSPLGDYTFGAGLQNFYIDVPAAVGQAVGTRLKLWRGEWSFDTSQGTPYLDGIIGKHSKETADQTIQAQVLGTLNLTGIQKYDSADDTEARSLSVQMNVDTVFGPTAVTLQNYVNY